MFKDAVQVMCVLVYTSMQGILCQLKHPIHTHTHIYSHTHARTRAFILDLSIYGICTFDPENDARKYKSVKQSQDWFLNIDASTSFSKTTAGGWGEIPCTVGVQCVKHGILDGGVVHC